MKLAIPLVALALALSVSAGAQDSTTKSKTKIKVDEGRAVAMTGCLRQDTAGTYTLFGTMSPSSDKLETKSKVKRDVDRDKTKVTATTSVDTNGAVATTGGMTTFAIASGSGVDLASHVGQQVQIAAVMVDPRHHDAEVKVEDETKVDPDHARD